MYDTPVKKLTTNTSSLRNKIQTKLLTDKKKQENKPNLLKKFQSNIKNPSLKNNNSNYQSNLFQQTSKGLIHLQQTSKGLIHLQQPLPNKNFQQITESKVLQFESLQNQNFFGYPEWVEFNSSLFPHVDVNTVKMLWKIMRIINYGDVLIPSGLIYQVSKFLSSQEYPKTTSLKQIFNNFLSFNKISDQVCNFRELKGYPPLDQVQKNYRRQEKNKNFLQNEKSRNYSSLKKLNQSKDVFERNYEDSKSRIQKKSKNLYATLVQKQNDPECVFKPQINSYFPQKLFVDQTLRPSRQCDSNKKWNNEQLKQEYFQQIYQFKATPFEKTRFQNQSLEDIPGVVQHIERRKCSEAQKRKVQRYLTKPTNVFRHQ